MNRYSGVLNTIIADRDCVYLVTDLSLQADRAFGILSAALEKPSCPGY